METLRDRISERANGAYTAGSMSAKARARRWREFARQFPEIAEMSVLDLGGDARAWRASGIRPAHVTLVNLFPQQPEEPWMTAVEGDACALPGGLPAVDLVYSNSVIEHVGGHWRRERFAEGVRAGAPRYWVQTPYRYFPLEPHFLFPALQHLPRPFQAAAIRHWPIGGGRHTTSRSEAMTAVLEVDLLSIGELQAYFPDGAVLRERFAGAVKSLIAVRGGRAPRSRRGR